MTTRPTEDKLTKDEPTIFFETEYSPFEKKTSPVRSKPTIFAVPGVFVTSRPSVLKTQKLETNKN